MSSDALLIFCGMLIETTVTAGMTMYFCMRRTKDHIESIALSRENLGLREREKNVLEMWEAVKQIKVETRNAEA